jgi:hypothetical protein
MPSLAEMLGYIVQPMFGGPTIPILPKAQSNATSTGIPGVAPPKGQPLSSPAELMNALTAIGNARYENQLREAQAEQARATAGLFKTAVELGGTGPTYTTGGAAPPAAPSAWGSLAGPSPAEGPDINPSGGGIFSTIRKYESGDDYNVGTGGTDLSRAPRDEFGFPIWEGKGNSHAAGAYQFQPATWRQYAAPLGIKDFSKESQDAVARAAYLDQGVKPWAPYNPKLAAALARGEHLTADVVRGPDAVIGGAPVGGAPMSLAPGMPPSMPAVPQGLAGGMPRLDDASLARARSMENVYGILGKKMPTWAEEGVKMAPGGSMSPEYIAAIEATKGWAKVAPELFTQTQLKQVQGGIDLSLKEKQAMLDRANDDQKQRLAATLDVTTVTERLPGGSMVERPITRAELAGRVAPAPQLGAGATPTVPSAQPTPFGTGIFGKPVGIGPTPEGYQLVTPPGGGGTRQERIPGSPAAQAGEQAQGERQQAADIMKQDISRALTLSNNAGGMFRSTGVQGALFQGVPGTAAYDLRLMLDSIKANTAFDRITQMRNSNQTGAALGAVSDRDINLLQSTMGSLEQSQSRAQFETTLKRLSNLFQDVINGAPADLEKAVKEGKLSRSQFDAAIARREKNRYSDVDEVPAIEDGRTAINPSTNERLILRNGKWEPVR